MCCQQIAGLVNVVLSCYKLLCVALFCLLTDYVMAKGDRWCSTRLCEHSLVQS